MANPTPPTHEPTHQWVANRTGYSRAGVSLLRSGKRNPTLDTMEVFEEAFDWPMCDQTAARDDYAHELNKVLLDRYQKETQE